eukprot:gene34023-22714_t
MAAGDVPMLAKRVAVFLDAMLSQLYAELPPDPLLADLLREEPPEPDRFACSCAPQPAAIVQPIVMVMVQPSCSVRRRSHTMVMVQRASPI